MSIDSVIITATRLQESQLAIPLSTTKLNFSETQFIRQQLSFQEYLNEVPGLFSLNANNYSQDLRISLRGFGSRSAFGIRGIKLLVDGIPETTPDGQGQLDNLNLGIIEDIEVIRGPSATLYGNASGGIISIRTMNTVKKPFFEGDISIGNYGFQKYQILHGFRRNNTSFILQGNYTNTDGYRDQSGFSNYNFDAKMAHRFSENSKLNLLLNYTNSPYAEDAGGLTLDELNANRRQARQRNVDFKTEESVEQLKIGSSYELNIDQKSNFSTYGFFASRNFNGKLPFEFGGVIDLQRNYFGNGSSFEFKTGENRLQVGYDWAIQNDNRKRFRNLNGEQGNMTLDQLEQFSNLGIYLLDHWTLDKLLIRVGVRYDINKLEAVDDFLNNGDASGEIKLNAFNPSVGVTYRLNSKQSLFTGFSTSFETPTLSELSADPTGTGGFNEELEAQKARNFELGIKSKNENQSFEAVVFYIKTDDDLVPYELAQFPDRTFYRNAGSTKRKGLELSYINDLGNNLRLSAGYTYSHFRYDSYE
ncbi:MAG: TonB-dependent receptor, partial [Flavobacteriaceae bacterium]|nr:TonB-dependent receptor [Bacteroidia bacterium]NNL61461.1 TonB-dependent receptor [Flavobacteriaceae bacterium]